MNYLLFHSSIELFSIIIAFNIFIIVLNTYHISKNDYLTFIGIIYGFVAFFDLLHTLAYKGMGIFVDYGANLPTQLWIVARYIESSSLLIALFFFYKSIKKNKVILIYSSLSILVLLSIFYWGVFPDAFISYGGLTLLKIISEYVIIGILVVTIVFLRYINQEIDLKPKIYRLIMWSLLMTILSEVSFILYTDVYGMLNMIGHLFKLGSFYLIYQAINKASLQQPYELLFYELERTNKELKEKKNKFEQYLNISEIIFLVMNKDYEVELINQKGCEILGYCEDDIIGNNWFESFVKEDEKNRTYEIFNKMLNSAPELIKHFENNVLTKDDDERMIAWDNTVLRDEDGNIQGILSAGMDITERKKLKEELEYSKLQTEFFANLSHELKTPLNLIFSTLQMLDLYSQNNLELEDTKKVKKYINIMQQNGYRLLRLVNNLVDITKINANSFELNLQNYNIVEVVQKIVCSVDEYTKTKNKELNFNSELKKKVIACDPFNLERIILNLLSNAIKFTDEGDKIKVKIYEQGDYICISVKDTGIGIAKDDQEAIFKRFRQTDKSFTRNSEGSGIGLSIVKLLVEMHGGEIELKSKLGEGSEFIIKLPAIKVADNSSSNQDSYGAKDLIDRVDLEFSDIYDI